MGYHAVSVLRPLNRHNQTTDRLLLPKEKVEKGKQLLGEILSKKSKKVTLHELQKFCGFRIFLGKAIIPGRAFMHRMYTYTTSNTLKSHHHVKVSGELRADMSMWWTFLHHPTILSRPLLDMSIELMAQMLDMYSDASKNSKLGFGATCASSWMFGQCEENFIELKNPIIEYLELFGLLAGFMQWGHRFRNQRIILFCDNQSVVEMVNNTTSSCRNCMVLIRLLVLESLVQNVRVFA